MSDPTFSWHPQLRDALGQGDPAVRVTRDRVVTPNETAYERLVPRYERAKPSEPNTDIQDNRPVPAYGHAPRIAALEEMVAVMRADTRFLRERLERLEERVDEIGEKVDALARPPEPGMQLTRPTPLPEPAPYEPVPQLAPMGKIEKGVTGHMFYLDMGDRVLKVTIQDA